MPTPLFQFPSSLTQSTLREQDIVRISKDGAQAPGNPFEQKPGALPEIWTYGHRNPQGLV